MTAPHEDEHYVVDAPIVVPPYVRQISVGDLPTNCYLVTSPTGRTRDCVVVDPGAAGRTIVQAIRSLDLRLAMICLTHGHADHIGGLPQVLSAYPDCPVVANSVALERLCDLDRNLSTWVGSRLAVHPRFPRSVVDGEEIGSGDLRLRSIGVPGHTPGCMAYILVADAPDLAGAGPVLFSGDALFRGTVGRTDLPGGSWAALARSLAALAGQLPPQTLILPGHGQPSCMAWELKHNEYLRAALSGDHD